ncbi:hypothetical protein [Furfurilactobacillus milii]|uniref:Uncharacterized protein n=1 Tax=Furfurilactobacillus milii TaxID=2888272 RepID=A0A6N9HZR0_9LACO|nr:hypothetical protein [Furfurilactobacillus milii]MYV16069.1 hypothetical protein [Furfurilactobacillus milii]
MEIGATVDNYVGFIDDYLNNVLLTFQRDSYEILEEVISFFKNNPDNYHEIIVKGECCKDGIGKIFIFVDYHWEDGLDIRYISVNDE